MSTPLAQSWRHHWWRTDTKSSMIYRILAIFNNFEWPLTLISRARHYLTLNISETIQDRHMVTADHRQKAICGLLNSVVANAKVVSAFLCENKCSLYLVRSLIKSRRSTEGWHCQWPCVSFEGHFRYYKRGFIVCISEIHHAHEWTKSTSTVGRHIFDWKLGTVLTLNATC